MIWIIYLWAGLAMAMIVHRTHDLTHKRSEDMDPHLIDYVLIVCLWPAMPFLISLDWWAEK